MIRSTLLLLIGLGLLWVAQKLQLHAVELTKKAVEPTPQELNTPTTKLPMRARERLQEPARKEMREDGLLLGKYTRFIAIGGGLLTLWGAGGLVICLLRRNHAEQQPDTRPCDGAGEGDSGHGGPGVEARGAEGTVRDGGDSRTSDVGELRNESRQDVPTGEAKL